ncbi:hypothetical protein [Streptomyces sp. NPDC089919]|uniref:hypothetical protein n=1 Tax=Streptomyces sp. NPDC089919 TaxID=3155188 RepID=UPI003447AC3F
MRARTTAAVLVAGLLAAGCGIQGSDVIEAGGPAKVAVPSSTERSRALMYLVTPDGELAPVVRGQGFPAGYTVAPSAMVRMLLGGPNDRERAAGLRTEVPARERPELVGVEFGNGVVRVQLGGPVRSLSARARQQVVCTVEATQPPDQESRVELTGSDGALAPADCEIPRG